MKRLALALLLAAATVACDYDNSVQALQINGQTFCTAFSISEREGNWATAAHCALASAMYEAKSGLPTTIDGEQAVIVYIDEWTDAAVFQSATHAPALKLAKESPKVCNPKAPPCEVLYVVGYPYGIARVVTQGTMGARNIPLFHPVFKGYVISDILDVTIAGGNSGSPVLNSHGEVVGLLWGGFSDSPHGISVPLDSVRRAFGGYWQ